MVGKKKNKKKKSVVGKQKIEVGKEIIVEHSSGAWSFSDLSKSFKEM